MRLVVTGGRDYTDRATVFAALDALRPTEIAHGGASGADSLAGEWAKARGVPCTVFKADWDNDGRFAAGPIRNRRMLDEFRPELVVAFPGGNGTADCVKAALERRIRVRRVDAGSRRLVLVRAAPAAPAGPLPLSTSSTETPASAAARRAIPALGFSVPLATRAIVD